MVFSPGVWTFGAFFDGIFPVDLIYADQVTSPEQIAEMKALLLPFLTKIPSPGTNNIVVDHDDLFEATTGIYPDPQGMAYVVKPLGGERFTLVPNVRAEEWLELGQ
ncbi:hypothetical protein [Synechocystis sp. CACIAM 05]|uniref:hypothetical protein n=1 Tax=Synechocystis sp. CACIAM 05 TaxID=1933929 RepID=UPI001F25259F|nr:hypothetical protein [Synechocystis sp. CACIAM 05]